MKQKPARWVKAGLEEKYQRPWRIFLRLGWGEDEVGIHWLVLLTCSLHWVVQRWLQHSHHLSPSPVSNPYVDLYCEQYLVNGAYSFLGCFFPGMFYRHLTKSLLLSLPFSCHSISNGTVFFMDSHPFPQGIFTECELTHILKKNSSVFCPCGSLIILFLD